MKDKLLKNDNLLILNLRNFRLLKMIMSTINKVCRENRIK